MKSCVFLAFTLMISGSFTVQFQARFLMAVNATWYGPGGCVAMNSTHHFLPHNVSTELHFGKCDYGPLRFEFSENLNPGYFEDYSRYVSAILFLHFQ